MPPTPVAMLVAIGGITAKKNQVMLMKLQCIYRRYHN